VQIPKDKILVAVRVRVDPKFAILIKDANSTIQLTIVKDSNRQEESSNVKTFIEASYIISNRDLNLISSKYFKLCKTLFL
jgi:hypothetical protein